MYIAIGGGHSMGKYLIGDIFEGNFNISQPYGVNAEYYKQFGLAAHEGTDWSTPVGTPILAAFDGVVLRDAFSAKDYGNYLVLWDATQKCAVWYCHLNDTLVQVGQAVHKGDILGHTGNTGNTTGPHLHVNFVETDGSGNRLNMDNGYQGFLDINNPELVMWQLRGAANSVPTPAVLVQDTPVPSQAPLTVHVTKVTNVRQAPTTQSQVATVLNAGEEVHLEGQGVVHGESIDGNNVWLQLEGQLAYIWSGGTDYVATIPDTSVASVVVPQPTDTQTYTKDQYDSCMADRQKFWQERDEALKQVADLDSQLVTANAILSAFKAKGYTTVDDVDKVLKSVQDENTKLKNEVKQVNDSNANIALLYKAKCQEDSTAVDTGLKHEATVRDLSQNIQSIAGFVGSKPELKDILEKVNTLMQNQKPSITREVVQAVEKLAESPKSFIDLFGGGR